MELIGDKILFYRSIKKWTQERLAYKINIAQSTLSEIENNSISPRWEIIEKIAEALEIAPNELLPNNGITVYHNEPKDNAYGIIQNYIQSNNEQMIVLMKQIVETQKLIVDNMVNKQ